MNMKEHILTALREQFTRWEALLARLSVERLTIWQTLDDWTTHDVIAHLWAWQQISIARMEAATLNREPELPQWVAALQTDWEENANRTNAWVYATYHPQPWSMVYQHWSDGFRRFLELGAGISERDLLDASRYAWLEGHPLAIVLLASYDHHQEHLEKLLAWLQEHRHGQIVA
jgi:hypothetical protein